MSMIQAGSITLDSKNASETRNNNLTTFETVIFPSPFPAGANVIVSAQTQTFNGNQTPGIRLADVTEAGFKIRFNELVTNKGAISDGKHIEETVGWVAYSV